MRDYYEVLELPKGQERQVYLDRYNQLKVKYSEDMFLPGEDGNLAAKKLTELESAWLLLCEELDRVQVNSEFGSDYGQIDALVKEGKYDDAQATLDKLMSRDAEWHYYQSVIFYMREWMTECRKHLVIAVQMQPENVKYRQTLEKLDQKMANPNIPPNEFGAYPYTPAKERGCGNNLSDVCLAYCCADCCCSMLTHCC